MTERDSFKELSESLTLVRLDMRELMTEVRSLKGLQDKVVDQDTRITQTEESTKSAHKRLDKIDKIVFWLATTVIGAVILAILSVVLLKGGVK